MASTSTNVVDSDDELSGSTSEEEIDESDSSSEEESSSGDSDDDADPNLAPWIRVIGEDPGPTPVPFTGVPGPRHAPPQDAKPIGYVKLFLDDDFVDMIVRETNRYADQWINAHQDYLRQKPRSRVHDWIKKGHTTREEIRAFLSVVLNMGLLRKPTIYSYWDTVHPSQSTPWFVEHFSRDRYALLIKFLHFNDNEAMPAPEDPNYKLFKIQPVVDCLLPKFRQHFNPGEDISIDESMIGYKGKTPHLRQYMPNKHHARFGVKMWCLCDSTTGYTSLFEIYKGAADPADRAAEGMTYGLVMRLMDTSNLLHMGYHLGLDNYFSSPKLMLDLYAAHTTSTGTVRKNRKGLPKSALTAKLKNKNVHESRKGNLLCIAYKDGSKQPLLLSTKAKGGFANTTNSKGKEKRLPNAIVHYNKAMGGVDLSDARLYCYLSERRTMKWTNKVLFSLVGRAVLNAYIIYCANTTDTRKLDRYNFTIDVVEDLIGNFRPPEKSHRKRRTAAEMEASRAAPILPPTAGVQPAAPACKLEKLAGGKRRNCVYKHQSRKRTVYQCLNCDVGLCAECFSGYHADKS